MGMNQVTSIRMMQEKHDTLIDIRTSSPSGFEISEGAEDYRGIEFLFTDGFRAKIHLVETDDKLAVAKYLIEMAEAILKSRN